MEWMLLPYRRYFEFSGRSRRREYWMFALFCFLVGVAINIVFGVPFYTRAPGAFSGGSVLTGAGAGLRGLFGLFNLIPSLAVNVRRLHDIDRSGWWMLLWFVPILGWVVMLVFLCLDGTSGTNRFGFDPKGRGAAEIFH